MAIMRWVSGFQQACRVSPVAMRSPVSACRTSYRKTKDARFRSLIQHRTRKRSSSRAGLTYRTDASTTGM